MADAAPRRLRARLDRALGRRPPALRVGEIPPALLELARSGPAATASRRPAADAPLKIATVIPSFRHGSGGHATIVHLLQGLRALGHSVSLWLDDCEGRHARESPAVTADSFQEFFGAEDIEFHANLDAWQGADIVLATGWQTVARTLLLPDVAARAYLVQDHEPDFYGASAEALWAAQTYRQGLYCIAASPWLAALLRSRYQARATHFDLAVDHTVYQPTPTHRREDLLVFYARAATPRRGVPLGLAALAELARRRPDLEIALYGETRALEVPFAHRNLGILDDQSLATLYGKATVGMVLSLTNPSLIGLEMMACGLPCVELASESMLSTFGTDGPLELATLDPLELCAAIERRLDDPARREADSRAGVELMAKRTWQHAAAQLQEGLRHALKMSSVEPG